MRSSVPFVLTLLAGSFALYEFARPAQETAARTDDAPSSATEPVRSVVVEGVAMPYRVVNIGASIDGLLAEVHVDRGSLVEEGDLLAKLDTDVEQAAANLARARTESNTLREIVRTRRDESQRRYQQMLALFEESVVTLEELQGARTAFQLEELALIKADEDRNLRQLEYQRAHAILQQRILRAPIHGVVTQRYLSAGELMSKSGQANVVTVAQLDPLRIEINVPVELYDELQVGDPVPVELKSATTEVHQARVTIIDRIIDTASNTFRVRLEVPNPENRLPAGLRCRVRFHE